MTMCWKPCRHTRTGSPVLPAFPRKNRGRCRNWSAVWTRDLRAAGNFFRTARAWICVSLPVWTLLQALKERERPLSIHANEPVGHDYPGKGRNTPEPCYRFAMRHRDLKIIFGHLGGGLFLYE